MKNLKVLTILLITCLLGACDESRRPFDATVDDATLSDASSEGDNG